MRGTLARVAGPYVHLLGRLARTLANLIFGFDYFVSYAQEEATRVYARELQKELERRDFTCFLDETHLRTGDELGLLIRLALRRTRSLIVLSTEGALGSKWVADEVDLFSRRKRPILPIRRDDVLPNEAWAGLRDRLYHEDRGSVPAEGTYVAIVRAHSGMRVNRLARLTLGAVAIVALGAGLRMRLLGQTLAARSRALAEEAVFSIARSQKDPLTAALLLQELGADTEVPGLVDLAQMLARGPISSAVLRHEASVHAMAFSSDGKRIATADQDGVVRTWSADGLGDPLELGRSEWLPSHIEFLHGDAFVVTRSSDGLGRFGTDGSTVFFTTPEDRDTPETELSSEALGPERWAWSNAWRMSREGQHAIYLGERGLVVHAATAPSEPHTWELGGRAALDVIGRETEGGGLELVVLCTNGDWWKAHFDGRDFEVLERRRLAEPGHHFDLPYDNLGTHDDVRCLFADGQVVVALEVREHERLDPLFFDRLDDAHTPTRFTPERAIAGWFVSAGTSHALLTLDDTTVARVDLRSGDLSVPDPDVAFWARAQGIGSRSGVPTQLEEDAVFERPGITADGSRVALAASSSIYLWTPDAPGEASEGLRGDLFLETRVRPQFSPDGRLLAVADAWAVRVWLVDGSDRNPMRTTLDSSAYSLSHAAERALVGTSQGAVYQASTALRGWTCLIPPRGVRVECAISPDGRLGVGAYADGAWSAWDLESGAEIARGRVEGVEDAYRRVAFVDPVRCLIASEGSGALLVHVDPEVLSEVEVDRTSLGWVRSTDIALSREGHLVALDGRFLRWLDLRQEAEQEEILLPDRYQDPIWELAISDDGTRVVLSAGELGPVVWRPADGSFRPLVIPGLEEGEMAFSLAFPGNRLAAGFDTGRIALLRTPSMGFERWLAAPGLDNQAEDGTDFSMAHVLPAIGLTASLDRGVFASTGADGFLRVWRRNGEHVAGYSLLDTPTGLGFLRGGRELLILGEGGTVAQWRFELSDVLDLLRERTSAVLLPAQRMRYLRETRKDAWRRYSRQERLFGRTPLGMERAFDIDIQF